MRSVSFKGVWYGLSHGTRRAALGYAVIEGVAFALLDGYRALRAAGTNGQMAFLVGGGSKSCYWASLLANALRLPLLRQSGSDLGAARMGMIASNPTADVGANCVVPPVVDVIEPRLDWIYRTRCSRASSVSARYTLRCALRFPTNTA